MSSVKQILLLLILLSLPLWVSAQYRPVVPEVVGLNCTDKRDNDLDGLADADDSGCTVGDDFTATTDGFAVEIEDCRRAPASVWDLVADTTASPSGGSGEAIRLAVGRKKSEGQVACTGLTTDTYDVFAKVQIPSESAAEVCVKADTIGFAHAPDTRECTLLNQGQATSGWAWIQLGRYDTYTGVDSQTNTTPLRQLAVTTGQALWVLAADELLIDCLYLRPVGETEEPQCPSGSGGQPTTAEHVILEMGANSHTASNGAIDAFVGQANAVVYTGTDTGNLGTATATRFAHTANTSPTRDRLHFWHTTTLANLTSGGAPGAEDGGSVLSGSGLRFSFRIANLNRVRDASTYTVAVNSVGANYTRNDLDGGANSAYDFPSIVASASYAANVMSVEGYVELEEDVTPDQLILLDVSANELVSGSPQTTHFAKCAGTSITDPICWMVAQLSSTAMVGVADTTAPTVGTPGCPAPGSTSFTCTATTTEAATCSLKYDTDNDGEVVGDAFFTNVPCAPSVGGVCTCPVSGRDASTLHEVVIQATDSAGNVGTSAVTDVTTAVETVSGTSWFVSPSGNNSNNCTTSGTACKNFSGVFAKATFNQNHEGATVFAANGTYSGADALQRTGSTSCASNPAKFSGTASAPIIIKATNERQAILKKTSGSIRPLDLDGGCHWWRVEGFIIEGGDFSSGDSNRAMSAIEGNNNVLRRNIFTKNNRYVNSGIFAFADGSVGSRMEANEFYSFSRNGPSPGSQAIYKYNYLHGRCHADIPGGVLAGSCTNTTCSTSNTCKASGGDSGIITYTADTRNSKWLNNISERNNVGFQLIAQDDKVDNLFASNISLNETYGFIVNARDAFSHSSPIRTTLIDNVARRATAVSSTVGYTSRGSKQTLWKNNTALNYNTCFSADRDSTQGSGAPYPITLENNVSLDCTQSGMTIDQSDIPVGQWTNEHPLSNGNGTNYSPSTGTSGYSSPSTANPNLANPICIPRNNAQLAGTGTNGADRGANAIWRYNENGTRSANPWWVTTKPASCPTSSSGLYPYDMGECVTDYNKGSGLETTSYYSIADRLGLTQSILDSCTVGGNYPN